MIERINVLSNLRIRKNASHFAYDSLWKAFHKLSRKNSLFSGTHQTAQDAAMIFSLFETCKRHNVDPQDWLTDVLYKINDPEFEGKYSDLMPHRWKSNF